MIIELIMGMHLFQNYSKEECYKYYFDPTLTCYLIKSKNSYVCADKNQTCSWSLTNKVSDDLELLLFFIENKKQLTNVMMLIKTMKLKQIHQKDLK
jgi:hypothetical protein